MATKHFSRSQLFALRNNISVDTLIKEVLNVPCKSRQKGFAFLCPLCGQFDTGINHNTNLARCFACEKNFNTIDLVMVIKHLGFVDSVRFLKKLHDGTDSNWQTSHQGLRQSSCPAPGNLGSILNGFMEPMTNRNVNRKMTPCDSSQPLSMDSDINNRIAKLEQKMEALAYQLNKILKVMDRLFPSR